MEELLELLKDVRDDVDFENCTDLIDGKIALPDIPEYLMTRTLKAE